MIGLVMIPRMIDKARAYSCKTLGEYIFPCPLDKIILEFLGVGYKEFTHLAQKLTDEEIALWVNEKCLHRSKSDKECINQNLLQRKPDTQESLSRFNKLRDEIDPTLKNVSTWVDLIELDESHLRK